MTGDGWWTFLDKIDKLVGIPSAIIALAAYVAKYRASNTEHVSTGATKSWHKILQWAFRLSVFLFCIAAAGWIILKAGPPVYYHLHRQALNADGPYYLKKESLSADEENARKAQVAALTNSVKGIHSSDKASAVIQAVPRINGGLTAKELKDIIESGDSIFTGRHVFSEDRKLIIMALTRYLRYPLDDEMPGLLEGLFDSDKAECIRALTERQAKTLRWGAWVE